VPSDMKLNEIAPSDLVRSLVTRFKDVSYETVSKLKFDDSFSDGESQFLSYMEAVALLTKTGKSTSRDLVLGLLNLMGFSPKRGFDVRTNKEQRLLVGGSEIKKATDDVCVLTGKNEERVIVVECKKLSETEIENSVAQLVAEGIAASQHAKEPSPVLLVLVLGHRFTFFRALFAKHFLNRVRIGRFPNFTTLIYKWHPEEEPASWGGFDLLTSTGRAIVLGSLDRYRQFLIKTAHIRPSSV